MPDLRVVAPPPPEPTLRERLDELTTELGRSVVSLGDAATLLRGHRYHVIGLRPIRGGLAGPPKRRTGTS